MKKEMIYMIRVSKFFIKRISIFGLTACLMLSSAGCQKKADDIEVLEGEETSSSSDADNEEGKESKTGDSSESKLSNAFNISGNDASTALSEKWVDSFELEEGPFERVDVNATVYEYNGVNKVVTVQADEYDKDYIKEMCDRVYHTVPEVYDYNAKTKRLYDKDIEYYTELKNEYNSDRTDVIFYTTDDREESLDTLLEEANAEVDATISALEKEKEAAPETVENDYSYGGYVGDIQGDEYYMYFGNCNYDEFAYLEAPTTTCYDGRVCTIFRTDIASLYDGKKGFISHYGMAGTADTFSEPPEDIKMAADKFVDTIGFGDYKFVDGGSFFYQDGLNSDIVNSMDTLNMNYENKSGEAGYVLTYTLGGTSYETLLPFFFRFDNYVDNKEAMSTHSSIYVFVNEKGVLGCQLENPFTVKNEADTDIISIDDVKDIISQNVQSEEAWNITSDSVTKMPEIDTLQLIYFPIRSSVDESEYTFVPAYIAFDSVVGSGTIDSTSASMALQSAPFMLINAVDGSFIDVNENLSDYPAGYKRGNEGYEEYITHVWKRFEGMNEEDYYD